MNKFLNIKTLNIESKLKIGNSKLIYIIEI